MKRRSERSQTARAAFAAAVVEHGDWRVAAEATQTAMSTAREWMAQLGQLFRSPVVVASPVGAPVSDGLLYGGEDALARILAAFEEQGVRCVSLYGVLGVGKTRLAVEAARRMRSSAGDILVARLTGASTREDVLHRVTQAITQAGGKLAGKLVDPAERISYYLRNRDPRGSLLILDDVDGACESLPGLLASWLEQSAYLEVIFTSRAVLEDLAAYPVRIAPLTCPEPSDNRGRQLESPAVRLFIHHGLRSVSDRELDRNTSAISEIVTALDGLPRHIQIAAEQLSERGFDGLREALASPLELLDSGRDRNRLSVRSQVEQAWRELGPLDRDIVGACSVHLGPLLPAASVAVAACTPEQARCAFHNAVRGGLGLSEHVHGQSRFRLLRVSREIAMEHAQSTGSWSAALERHAGYYGERALAWIGDFGRLDLAQRSEIRLALPDLRAACARAKDGLVPAEDCLPIVRALVHNASGAPLALTRAMVEDLWARRAQLPIEGRAGLSLAYGKVLRAQGHLAAATHQLTVARRSAREVSLNHIRVESLLTLARVMRAQRRNDRARRLAAQSIAEARELSCPRLIAEVLIVLSHIEMMADELPLARELLDEALGLASDAGLHGLVGQIWNHLGGVAWYGGDTARAEDDWHVSLKLHAELGDDVRGAYATGNLAALYIVGENTELARSFALRARPIASAYGDPLLVHSIETVLSCLDRESGDLASSAIHADEALASVEHTDLRRLQLLSRSARGAIYADLGKLSEARAELRAAELIAESLGAVAPHVSLTVAHIALAEAKEAGRRVMSVSSDRAREKAVEIAGGIAEGEDSLGIATELRALKKVLLKDGETDASAVVVVHTDGAWFQMPHCVPVDLSRRPLLSKILRLLLGRRLECPGQAVSVSELFAAAWPVETRSSKQSLRNRLYVAIARLRKLGLDTVLESASDGYRFSAEIDFEVRQSTDERFAAVSPTRAS